MIQLPKLHIADETLMRIGIVAKQTRPLRRGGAQQAPELVEMPPPDMPAPMPPQGPNMNMQPPSDMPPMDQSGLDQGTMARGGSSFNALTKGM